MSVTLTKLQNNHFVYEKYNDNSLIGFNGTLTSGSCYINNGGVYSGMLLDHVDYSSNDTAVTYPYTSQPVNTLVILRGYNAKIDGIGGGPQGIYNNCFAYIPANKSGTIKFIQPLASQNGPFYVDRVII